MILQTDQSVQMTRRRYILGRIGEGRLNDALQLLEACPVDKLDEEVK